jgi:selenocysteine-specific elongation factor
MRIVGTAGHVDHGKSSLVISLTGHNPDRWIEERERGMTLDLGFAPLRFADGVEAGIIDVPGHERFLHNMLAGAAGIDVLLLVVDALEGPRAQTLEHLQILDFLNVRRAVIVLTKSDLADADALERAAQQTRVAGAGTVAAAAPVIAVSNATGAGIPALKEAIHDALVGLPPARSDAPAYLPVDRVFALQGHGTIVTGTLVQGTLRAGDVLALQPSGLPARVRSLQIFGRKVKSADAGSRVAVNVPGLGVAAIRRGDVLAAQREFEPASELSVRFTPLRDAMTILRRRMPVRVHVGSAEIEGRMVLDELPSDARAVAALISLSRPTVVYRGQRMIVRRLSPKELLGGASIVDRSAVVVERQEDAPDDEICATAIAAAGLDPLSLRKVAAGANIREDVAAASIGRLLEGGRIVALAKPIEYVARASSDAAFARAETALRDRHRLAPWRLGSSTSEIAAALGVSDALGLRLLTAWHDDGRVGMRARFWHMPDFTPALTREQRAFFDKSLADNAVTPLLPASYDAVTTAADAGRIAGAREALESLIAAAAVYRIGDDLYRRTQMERVRDVILDVMRNSAAGATTSTLREALGISRKHALPLLEHMDGIGFTVRDGDLRRVRVSAGKSTLPV